MLNKINEDEKQKLLRDAHECLDKIQSSMDSMFAAGAESNEQHGGIKEDVEGSTFI